MCYCCHVVNNGIYRLLWSVSVVASFLFLSLFYEVVL